MACSSNCNNVVLKSEQILLEQWQLIQFAHQQLLYAVLYLFSFTSTQRIPESVAACSIGEDGFALVFGCLLTVLNPAHSSRAFCHGRIVLRSSDSGPRSPADGSPLRETAGALWNSSLATGKKAGTARKRKRSAQPVPAQPPSAVLEVA
ncbi:Hypothetical_protein [Hexamita inflata]|uniref:Hypothetical_protein n=1 Tax=Hexamita inflata TaxID=28002 RepID=A0AA86S5C2_9EUKA|nr:Hypothetical protein HINF_LOCUS65965 [Hexamita inflata]